MHINGNEISLCKPTEKEFFQVFPFPLFSCTRSLWLPCLCLRFSLISLVVFYSLDCTLLGLLDTFWYISFYERTPKPKHFRFRMLLTSSSPDAVLLLLTPATSCTVSKQTHTLTGCSVWVLAISVLLWSKACKYLSVSRKTAFCAFCLVGEQTTNSKYFRSVYIV